jgi:hypothetical protein
MHRHVNLLLVFEQHHFFFGKGSKHPGVEGERGEGGCKGKGAGRETRRVSGARQRKGGRNAFCRGPTSHPSHRHCLCRPPCSTLPSRCRIGSPPTRRPTIPSLRPQCCFHGHLPHPPLFPAARTSRLHARLPLLATFLSLKGREDRSLVSCGVPRVPGLQKGGMLPFSYRPP